MDPAVPPQKPDRLTAIAVMTLVSGILNIFWSIGLFLAIAAIGVGTFLIGCICLCRKIAQESDISGTETRIYPRCPGDHRHVVRQCNCIGHRGSGADSV
jgi:hypothetical protein